MDPEKTGYYCTHWAMTASTISSRPRRQVNFINSQSRYQGLMPNICAELEAGLPPVLSIRRNRNDMADKKNGTAGPCRRYGQLRMAVAYGADAVYLARDHLHAVLCGQLYPGGAAGGGKAVAGPTGSKTHVYLQTMPRNDEIAAARVAGGCWRTWASPPPS